MMTKNIFKNYLNKVALLTVFAGVLFSCNQEIEVDALFEDSAAVRINKSEANLRELLKSSPEGWKTTYFTDNQLLGGYTFIFDFEDDKNVRMSSDFDADFTIETSEYDVIIGSTMKLSFVTKNEIHKLSDSNNFPVPALRGQGYKGDFEFLYYGQEGDELIFKSNRDLIELRFQKAVADDWTQLAVRKAMRENLESDKLTSVFKLLIVKNGAKETKYDLNYNEATLLASPATINSDGEINEFKFGIAATPMGIVVDPSIEVDGVSFKDFEYDVVKSQFIATVGAATASIGFFGEPAFITKDVLGLGQDPLETFGMSTSYGSNPLTSPGFDTLIESVEQNILARGLNLPYSALQFQTSPDGDGYTRVWVNFGGNWFGYNFTSVIKEDKFFLTYVGPRNGNGAAFEAQIQPIIDMFSNSLGLYYKTEGSFSGITSNGTAINYNNLSGAFVSAGSPNIRFYGLWF